MVFVHILYFIIMGPEIEITISATVKPLIKIIEVIEKDRETAKLAQLMATSLHDAIGSGARFTREDLALIIEYAKSHDNMMMQQDAESRLRNLVSN